MNPSAEKAISGVFPVLPTPFDANLKPDREALKVLVRYLLRSGVDGMTYPGVASEFAQLTQDERLELTQLVLTEVAGRVPVVAGVSSDDMAITLALAKSAAAAGAAALMVAAPSGLKTAGEQVVYFAQLAAAALLTIGLATLSGMSKAETERIFLPFTIWIVALPMLLPERWHRPALLSQVVLGLSAELLLLTRW